VQEGVVRGVSGGDDAVACQGGRDGGCGDVEVDVAVFGEQRLDRFNL